MIPGEAVRITASFGVACLESGATTLAEMIKQADQALYLAKNTGRNRVCRYEDMGSGYGGARADAARQQDNSNTAPFNRHRRSRPAAFDNPRLRMPL